MTAARPRIAAAAFLFALVSFASVAKGQSDSSAAQARARRDSTVSPAVIRLDRDSIAFLPYRHASELVATQGGFSLYDLGSPGQPAWFGRHGSSPMQSALLANGISTSDYLTGQADPYLVSTEDASSLTIYPMHQSFWYGGPGMLSAADFTGTQWKATRPFTRIRHTESSYEELFTDVQFALSPGERDHLFLGVTRATIGTTANGDPARFANTRAERWQLRASYRRDLGERVTGTIANDYNDQIVHMHGGVLGTVSGVALLYPDAGGAFPDTAFSEIAATFVNPHYRAKVVRNESSAAAAIDWRGDATEVSTLTASVIVHKREVTNSVEPVLIALNNTSTFDTLRLPKLDSVRKWNLFRLSFRHVMSLPWAELEARASAGVAGTPGLDLPSSLRGIVGDAAAMLRLPLGPIRLSLFARGDRAAGGDSYGVGATAEISSGALQPWAGLAFTTRAPSPLETATRAFTDSIIMDWTSRRQTTGTAASNSGISAATLEKSMIAEAGLRASSSWLEADLRGSYRSVTSPFSLVSVLTAARSLGTERFPGLAREDDGSTVSFAGVSLRTRFALWKLYLENTVSLTAVSGGALRLAPSTEDAALLYFQGGLIEGTLRVKAGAGLTYRSAFDPAGYDPVSGAFAPPSAFEAAWSAARSYTPLLTGDLFLYATIKEAATLHVILHNVFDARYITSRFYPMPNRDVSFGVNWVFLD
jgi:hypothetical protein